MQGSVNGGTTDIVRIMTLQAGIIFKLCYSPCNPRFYVTQNDPQRPWAKVNFNRIQLLCLLLCCLSFCVIMVDDDKIHLVVEREILPKCKIKKKAKFSHRTWTTW